MNEQLEHTVRLLTRAAQEENILETQIMYRALLTFEFDEKSMDGYDGILTKYNVALNVANRLNQKDREVAAKFGITAQEIQEQRAEMRTGLVKSTFPDKYPNE